MTSLLESYRILGVNAGADLSAVTTSYKQLCREYHPDISDSPEAEEMMKQVNVAYMVLRDKFKREAAFRDKAAGVRTTRRYTTEPPRTQQQTWKTAPDPQRQAAEDYYRRAAEQAAVSAEAESDSRRVLHDYFKALNTFDYKKAYSFLSEHDKRNITSEGFAQWRESVAKLYPMREFKIAERSSVAVVTWGGNKIFHARKFKVIITEDSLTASKTQSGEHDKLVVIENGEWRVFLGYREISELTRTFEKRFEAKKKHAIEKQWEEYAAGRDMEYDMYNMAGMRKASSRELYRQRRYGAPVTFAAISIKLGEDKKSGLGELLRSAAKTIKEELREIDISGYAGDGVFAVLFVELGRKNAQNIVGRLVDTIRKNADPGLGEAAQIDYSFDSWSENRYADIEEINNVLRKYGKKI